MADAKNMLQCIFDVKKCASVSCKNRDVTRNVHPGGHSWESWCWASIRVIKDAVKGLRVPCVLIAAGVCRRASTKRWMVVWSQ